MSTPFQLVAAPHTPFTADGSLHLPLVAEQARLFARNGIDGVFACGTTGEGPHMTTAERKQVAERWAEVKGDLRLIIHAGHSCQRDVIDLAAHAKGIGAAAVAALAPHFIKPTTPEELVEFFRPVAAACAPLPFLYYDIPSLTGVRASAARFLELADGVIPNVGGVKFTNIDAITLQECVTAGGGRFEVFFGVDELLLAALSVGGRRAVGSTYNFTSHLHRKVIAAFDAGDKESAKALQRESVRVVRVLEKYGGPVVAGKAAMKLYGLDLGPVRSPLTNLTAEQEKGLHAELRQLGINPVG
jgi:N-acetylneuraminate lyase